MINISFETNKGRGLAFSLRWALFLFSLFAMPPVAFANAGVPMIFLTFPSMLVALVPVIFLEAAVFEQQLHLK